MFRNGTTEAEDDKSNEEKRITVTPPKHTAAASEKVTEYGSSISVSKNKTRSRQTHLGNIISFLLWKLKDLKS